MTAPITGDIVAPDGVDDLQRAYQAIRRQPYTFQWADRQWTLPHLGELDYRLQAEIESVEGLDVKALENLFARIFGPTQAAAWAQVEVPTPVLMMLFDRWVKHAGGELGEQPASKPSSVSTGRKSRPTSGPTTTSASPKRSTAKRVPRKAATVVSLPGN